jgi:AAA family ATP:ADP antiporter
VESDEPEVQLEAVYYVCRFGPQAPEAQLRDFWSHANPKVRAAAIACVARHGNHIEIQMAYEGIREVIGDKSAENADVRLAVAKAFASMDSPALTDPLGELVGDVDATVARQAIDSAAHLTPLPLIPSIEARLCDSATAPAARNALAAYGPDAVHHLSASLLGARDGASSDVLCRRIPRVLQMIGTDAATKVLIEALAEPAADLAYGAQVRRYHVVKALNRLRRDQPKLSVPQAAVHEAGTREVRLQLLLPDLRAAAVSLGDSAALLVAILDERWEQSLERLFRLLALVYPPREIYNAYAAIRETSGPTTTTAGATLRANALELLDNVLSVEVKRVILPLVEDGDAEMRLKPLRDMLGVRPPSQRDALDALQNADDALLSGAAYYALRLLGDAGQELPDGSPALSDGTNARGMDVNLLEKVAFLKRAELFADIDTEQLAQVAAAAAEVEFDAGDVVFRQHEFADSVCVVVCGTVSLSGEESPEDSAGEGEVFGMLALFADEARLLTAVAVDPTRALRLDYDVFMELLADHVEICRGMLKNLTQKIQRLSAELHAG